MITVPSTQFVGEESARVAFICVNGILTNPGDAEGWTDRAVTWLNLRTAGKAEKFEYATGALTRRLRQQWRAEAIARMASFYIAGGYQVVLIGHSNGCDLIGRVLSQLWPAKVRSAHLFAAATDAAAFSHALDEEQLGGLFLYGSAHDQALRVAALSRRLFGWAGLGYGDLGRRPEIGGLLGRSAVLSHRDDTQGHGTWFERGEPFERTMRLLLRHEFFIPAPPLP